MHLTYKPEINRESLGQGDILIRTEGVEEILKAVHPHYFQKPDYKLFIVLTQSCDLVLREDGPKARYITIAAVRPYDLAVDRFMESILYSALERKLGLCEVARKAKLEQFIHRLLNNNEPEYFFLKGEPGTALPTDHCAFLHLSVALKATLHYPTLLDAKRLQLTESFQHKLGYLTGQMYSRPGTKDWVPHCMTEEDFQAEIQRRVDNVGSVNWLERQIYRRVMKGLKKLPEEEQTLDAAVALIKDAQKQKKQRLSEHLDIVQREAEALHLDMEVVESLRARLENSPVFKEGVK